MSYYWTPTCTACGEDGPKIRSGHSGLKFGPDHSTELLKQWLDQHEHHDVRLRGEGMSVQSMQDGWNPQFRLSDGPAVITNLITPSLPGTRQIIGNNGDKPLVIRAAEGSGEGSRFVLPDGVSMIVVPPHGTAVFVAEKPSRWRRLWCRLRGRAPTLRWRYQDQPAPKAPDEERSS